MWATADEVMDFEADESAIEYFTHGQCGALAYEIHQLTGWSLGLISDQPVGSPDYMGHLFVFDSDGLVVDIKGRRTLDEVRDEWYFCPYVHRFFSLKEFEYEMLEWDMKIRYDKDKLARRWARYIADILS